MFAEPFIFEPDRVFVVSKPLYAAFGASYNFFNDVEPKAHVLRGLFIDCDQSLEGNLRVSVGHVEFLNMPLKMFVYSEAERRIEERYMKHIRELEDKLNLSEEERKTETERGEIPHPVFVQEGEWVKVEITLETTLTGPATLFLRGDTMTRKVVT